MTDPTYKPMRQGCCSEPTHESTLRNNYFEGKRLSVDSFRREQRYALDKRRLLNRAVHGWGVVYGYEVTAIPPSNQWNGGLKVGDGLALDICGRELLQAASIVGVAELIFVDANGRITKTKDVLTEISKIDYPVTWLLSVHYAEKFASSVTVENPCRCDSREWDHIYETVRFSLRPIQPGNHHSNGECSLQCDCNDPSNRSESNDGSSTDPNGRCHCICNHLTHLSPGAAACELREIDEPCGPVRVDIHNGVPLACVKLLKDQNRHDQWVFDTHIDACGPRRLVKRNDLLYDLLRGCDLTRISEIGWHTWHRQREAVPFAEFSNALGEDGDKQESYVATKFYVEFSGPVKKDSLRPDCFAISLLNSEREGWCQTYRVPIVAINTEGFEVSDKTGYVRGARLVFDGAWVEDAVRGRKSLFLDADTRIEIEIRCDFIIDCNGQAVAANASNLAQDSCCNSFPGGIFLSTFQVAKAPANSGPYNTSRTPRGV